MKKKARGQSSIEYVIIFAVIAAALIAVAVMFSPKIRSAIGGLSGSIRGQVQ